MSKQTTSIDFRNPGELRKEFMAVFHEFDLKNWTIEESPPFGSPPVIRLTTPGPKKDGLKTALSKVVPAWVGVEIVWT